MRNTHSKFKLKNYLLELLHFVEMILGEMVQQPKRHLEINQYTYSSQFQPEYRLNKCYKLTFSWIDFWY
jgi:hypothetical protein